MLRATCLAFLIACLGVGCEGTCGRNCYTSDPLLLSRKPIEGGESRRVPERVAHAEPRLPLLPAVAFVTPPPFWVAMAPDDASPVRQVAQLPEPPKVQATPVARRKAPVGMAHAPNYSWLQGVVTKDASGHWRIHYEQVPRHDTWGGVLRLEPDARFKDLEPGEWVRMTGELVPAASVGSFAREESRPTYQIREFQVIEPPQ